MKAAEEEGTDRKPVYRDRRLQLLLVVSFTALMGYTLITPVFPAMINDLGVTTQEVGLLITFYSLPGILFVPVLGVLSDRFGRKKIMVPGLILFGIAGGACAFVRDFRILLALRFVQGLGGSSLFTLSLTLIGDIYSGSECTQAMGYNYSVAHFANASYPFIGGAVALAAWYYPFLLYFLAVPVGVLVLLKLEKPELGKNQDVREYMSDVFSSVKNRQVIGIFLCSFVSFVLYAGIYLTYFSLTMAESFGASPFDIGLIVSVGFISAAITSSQLRLLARCFSERNIIKVGFVLVALALVAVPLVSNLWQFAIPAIIFGVGFGLIDPVKTSILSGLVPTKCRATLMSMNESSMVLGMSLGPVLMAAVFTVWGISGVFNAGAVLAMVAFVLMWFMLRQNRAEEKRLG